ncbi:sugar kinase [Leifsonia sp. AG29]|uniref:sugar kinase n=1 Tax=Leifsonia sp. AG29 TaxID=2598860 RepID=UPI0018EF19BA|nr:sugar kinase [Leifsonia sp. AG29]
MNPVHVCTLGETLGLVWAEDSVGLETATTARVSIGGAESNVAIGVRRLGLNAHWIGRVGDDSLGRRISRELRAEGVTTSVVVDPTAPTAIMIKERRSTGRTAVHYYRDNSAGSRLESGDINPSIIAGSAILHVTGITPSLSLSAKGAVFFAMKMARDAGKTVAFDVNHRSKLWPSGNPDELYRTMASLSDIVFAGLDEACLLLGTACTPEEASERISALGARQVVIKLGDKGCHALVGGRHYDSPAIQVPVYDSVGAGDAFVASYLYGVLMAWDVEHRLAYANRAGAIACMNPGDWESLPRYEDLLVEDSSDPVVR